MTLLLVMLGAAVGAPSRWLLDQAVQSRYGGALPLGTLVINVSGSALLGAILGAAGAGSLPAAAVALAGAGFCGGFTTYSTFAYETVRLVEDGSGAEALLNVALSLGLGLVAALGGFWLAQSLLG